MAEENPPLQPPKPLQQLPAAPGMSEGQEVPMNVVDLLMALEVAAAAEALATDTADLQLLPSVGAAARGDVGAVVEAPVAIGAGCSFSPVWMGRSRMRRELLAKFLPQLLQMKS